MEKIILTQRDRLGNFLSHTPHEKMYFQNGCVRFLRSPFWKDSKTPTTERIGGLADMIPSEFSLDALVAWLTSKGYEVSVSPDFKHY